MLLFVLFVISIFVFCFYQKYQQKFNDFYKRYQFAKTIPGPSFRELRQNTGRKLLGWFENLQSRYGTTFRIWLGKDLFVFISHPDDVKAVLSSNSLLYKSYNYDMVRPWLGNGLLTNGGSSWHQRRKLLTPAFHFKILSTFKEPIEDSCDILIKKLSKNADGITPIDVYPFITLFALDAISETAMGIKQYAQEKSDSEFVTATKEICKILHHQSFSLWKRIPFLYNLSDSKRQRDKYLATLHGETRRVIKLRRNLLKTLKVDNVQGAEDKEDVFGVKRRLAFLDILLLAQQEGANLTDENIQEEVDTFMFEGHDTTSSAIAFALYLLAKTPIAQQKAYEEAIEFVGKESEPMKYMEAVIKETLRLYPSVPLFSRLVNESFELNGKQLPKGTFVSILAYVVHRNSTIFPEPEKFHPERYLTNNEDFHPFSFVGFSAGPRNCIGQRFAMLELKCTLSKLLRAFEFLPVDGFEIVAVPELVMKSATGVQVRLRRRSDGV